MSTINSYGTSGSAPKGSCDNPYTMDEFESMFNANSWTGGYVTGLGLVGPDVDFISSFLSSGYGSIWWSEQSLSFPNNWPDNDEDDGGGSGDDSNGNSPSDGNGNPNESNGNPNESNGNPNESNGNPNESNGNGNHQESGIIVGEVGFRYVFNSKGTFTKYVDNNIGVHKIFVGEACFILERPLEIVKNDTKCLEFIATFDVFKFLSNHTTVEWAASYNDNNQAYLSTSHLEHEVNPPILPGYTNLIHSHPSGQFSIIDNNGDLKEYSKFKNKTSDDSSYAYSNFFIYLCGKADGINNPLNVTKYVK